MGTSTMHRKPVDPLPDLKRPLTIEQESFTRAEVAEMFGNAFTPSHISKIQKVLSSIDPFYPIGEEGIWEIYVYQCWRRIQLAEGKQHVWADSFVAEFKRLGQEKFIERYVTSWGGSRDHCRKLIQEYRVRKSTTKIL